MPYAVDKNNKYILNEDGSKIEYHVEYEYADFSYTHREPIHLNDNGHFDTENKNIIIKDGYESNHAVSKKQLDEINNDKYSKQDIDNKLLALQTQITAQFKAHEAKIITQMLNFRNEQIKNRIQRKYLNIPKTPNTVIKIFDYLDIGDNDLKNVIILNVWIKRFDRYHHAKSALVEKEFGNTLEFFYSSDMKRYSTYFITVPSNWDMSCFIEWLRIPQPISIDNESTPSQ